MAIPANTRKLSAWLWDLSGAFADIGVLFPLAIPLIAKNGFNPTALFLAAGLFYIGSACYFRITMPVQPLKAMAAIAIASGIGVGTIHAAGCVMGALLITLALTRWSFKLGALFPTSVIRGIQLGLGMILIRTSWGMITDDLQVALLALALLGFTYFFRKAVPPLIPVLVLGLVLSIQRVHVSAFGPVSFVPALPSPADLWTGFVVLVIPQIALTFGNAIVATEATAKTLYGASAARLNLKSIPLSMGIANIVTGVLGGVPMCHGSGGLTAHAKFGARSERSGYIIGAFLVVTALLFGESALNVISAFPIGILGVLLMSVGVLHATLVRDIIPTDWSPNWLADWFPLTVALVTAVTGVVSRNLTVGFAAGIALHFIGQLWGQLWTRARQPQRKRRPRL
ncbi:MAG TPA: putative sulfate/molybdate transporter [Bdellovibrionota bacterium]|nr:putative sulfate/molybdate transporter [Bdellovibrionota bacterium]